MQFSANQANANQLTLDDGTVLVGKLTAPEIYCDGVTQMMLGTPVSRLVFHSVTETAKADSAEVRRVVTIINMPTTGLVELAINILSAIKGNEDRFIASVAEMSEKSINLVKSIDIGITGHQGEAD